MKGKKTGGRQKGSKNKATLERERLGREGRMLLALQTAYDDVPKGVRGIHVMTRFLREFQLRAMQYRPTLPDELAAGIPPNEYGDAKLFDQWSRAAVDCAKELAKYQDPTFRSVQVNAGQGGAMAHEAALEMLDRDDEEEAKGDQKMLIDATPAAEGEPVN